MNRPFRRPSNRASMPSRRAVLRGALGGALSVALPLPRLHRSLNGNGDAFADGTPLPKRFGTWFFGNGVVPSRWNPVDEGVGDAWTLSEQLEPLQRMKPHVSVATGYDLDLGFELAHLCGAAAVLTGMDRDGGTVRAASIDQRIADVIGDQTPYHSLEVAVSRAYSFAGTITGAVSHNGPFAPNYPEADPNRLFARLFGISPASEELRALELSVLDAVNDDLRALRRDVGAEDRRRLDAHAEGIRAIERRLQAASAACTPPEPPGVRYPGITSDVRDEAPPELCRAMSELVVTALACDLTRVFSFMFSPPGSQVHYRHLGEDYAPAFHDNIVHVSGPDDELGLVTGGVRYTMACFCELLELMQAVPDGDGTLLDRTLVFGTSCIGRGWDHDYRDYPLLFAGGRHLGHRGDVHTRSMSGEPATAGALTAARILGIPMESIGADETYTDRAIEAVIG